MYFASFILPIILLCIGVSAFFVGLFIVANSRRIANQAVLIGLIPMLIAILILLAGRWEVRDFRADKYDLDRLATDYNAITNETSGDEPHVFHSRFFRFEYWAYCIPDDDYSEYWVTNNFRMP